MAGTPRRGRRTGPAPLRDAAEFLEDRPEAPGVILHWPGKLSPAERAEAISRPGALFLRLEEHLPEAGSTVGASPTSPWGNRLYRGDNRDAARELLRDLGAAFDLIYIDPPFATGSTFSVPIELGDRQGRRGWKRRDSSGASLAYRDRWGCGLGDYLAMLEERVVLARALLAPTGTFFCHVDRRVAAPVKLLLDEVFGEGQLINELIWCYTGPSSPKMRCFANKHDVIFWYARGSSWKFRVDRVRLPYKESTLRNEGRRTGFTTGNPDLVVQLHPGGKYPEDWWLLPVEAPASSRRTGYPTQKPERLLERLLLAASDEGDLVGDFFAGSGTTLAVAERLGRRWVGCDSSPIAVHTIRKRLLEVGLRAPFEVRARLAEEGAAEPPQSPGGGSLAANGPGTIDAAFSRLSPSCLEVELLAYHRADPGPPAMSGDTAPSDTPAPAPGPLALVDYWAVGPDPRGGSFRPTQRFYRRRLDRSLETRARLEGIEEGILTRAVEGAFQETIDGTTSRPPRSIFLQVIDAFGEESWRRFPGPA